MRRQKAPMVWFAILFAIVATLAVITPASQTSLHALHITATIYRLIIITLLAPYGLIWFAAFYAYDQLQQYARLLINSTEGHAFTKIARGLSVFAWGLMLTTILSLSLTVARDWKPGVATIQPIANEYAALLLALVAFTLIGDGTYTLVELGKVVRTKADIRWLVGISTLVGVLFVRFLIQGNAANNDSYHLSIYLLLLTIAAPYLYTWVVGLISTYELRRYASQVKGVLYKRALRSVSEGLTVVLLVSIVIQYITAAFRPGQSLTLGGSLLLIYGLLATEAVGFVMIAIGAKQLKKIEEV